MIQLTIEQFQKIRELLKEAEKLSNEQHFPAISNLVRESLAELESGGPPPPAAIDQTNLANITEPDEEQ